MNVVGEWVSERVIASVVMSLAFALPLALVLGLFGAHGGFLAHLGVALTLEYVLVYGVAEGVELAFERFFTASEIEHETTDHELPEAEQRISGS